MAVCEHVLKTVGNLEMQLTAVLSNKDTFVDVIQDSRKTSGHLTSENLDLHKRRFKGLEELSHTLDQMDQIEYQTWSRLCCIDFLSPGSSKSKFKICLVKVMPESKEEESQLLESCLDDVFLFKLLLQLENEASQSLLMESGDQPEAILEYLRQTEALKNATMIFTVALDFSYLLASKWILSCQRLMACRGNKTTTDKERAQRIQIEIFKSCLSKLRREEEAYHTLCGELKLQLSSIYSRIREAADEASDADTLNPVAQFEGSMETLDAWLQLKSEQIYNLQTLQEASLDLKARIEELETENAQMYNTLKDMNCRTAESGDLALQQEKELAYLKNELETAQNKEKQQAHQFELLTVKINHILQQDTELFALQVEMQELRTKCEQMTQMAALLADYECRIQSLSEESENLQKEKSSCHTELAELRVKHEALHEQIASLKDREIQKESLIVELQERLEDCRSSAKDQETEKQTVFERSQALAAEVESLKEERDQIKDQLAQTVEKAQQIEASIEKLQNETEEHKKYALQLEEQAGQLNSWIEEMKATIDTKEKEKQLLEHRLDQADKANGKAQALEREKALLLDKFGPRLKFFADVSLWFRLEDITGKPMGDIHDEASLFPSVFQSPKVDGQIVRKDVCTAEQALSSIVRITRLAYPPTDADTSKDAPDSPKHKTKGKRSSVDPTEVVMKVRGLRADRDDLRRRERLLKEENTQLK